VRQRWRTSPVADRCATPAAAACRCTPAGSRRARRSAVAGTNETILAHSAFVAVALIVATIAALVGIGGRISAAAILHTGPTLELRDARRRWTATTSGIRHADAVPRTTPTQHPRPPTPPVTDRLMPGVLLGLATRTACVVFLVAHDFVIGVAVGSAIYIAGTRVVKAHAPGNHRRSGQR
jgi:hypothetical protein